MKNEEKEKFDFLTGLKHQAEGAQHTMNDFRQQLGSNIATLALSHFRELNEMDAEDIRQFGQIISESARTLAEDFNKLNYKVKKKE